MGEIDSLKKKVAGQERRIKKLEDLVYGRGFGEDEVVSDVVSAPVVKKTSKKEGPKISFNQIITILGVVGISIGLVSFFFYGVAQGWFGEGLQVLIGVLLGLVLFGVAYGLRSKNIVWSNIVFGGSYFVEYLSIGVGTSVYKVMDPLVGLTFGGIILISSFVLTAKFASRAVAYFSLVGGFLIPIITGNFESQAFVMVWYLLLLIVLSVISVLFNWVDLRAVMLGCIWVYMQSSFGRDGLGLGFLFLALYFALFNISSLVNSVLNEKELNFLDSLILGALPVLFLPLFYGMLDAASGKMFGLVVVLLSFVYLIEAAYFKGRGEVFLAVKNTLVSVGIVALNIGIYFLFNEFFGLEYFIVMFIVEWALCVYLYHSSKNKVYEVMSYFALGLVGVWYAFVLRFSEGIGHATFFMAVLLAVPILSFIYFRSNINYKASAATFIISGYLVLFSFFKWLWYLMPSDSATPVREIILSILWLVYTLTLFVQVQTSEGKALVGVLLGITLVKIAFRDLFFLDGAARIVGFILFGVLLLIGGYFLKNERKD